MKALLTRFLLWCGIVKHPAQKEQDALIAWHNGPFRTHAREHPDAVAASSPTCVWCGGADRGKHSCPSWSGSGALERLYPDPPDTKDRLE